MFEFYHKKIIITKITKASLETISKNKIKWIRSLKMKKNRDLLQLFVVEGEKMVLELIKDWPEQIDCIVSMDPTFVYHGDCFYSDERKMKEVSQLTTPNKLLAVVRKTLTTSFSETNTILALDGIQDPGNMGTILRTADWFGITDIICSKQCVDVFNSKVIQSTMGSIFRLNIHYIDLKNFLQKTKLPIYGALLEGENVYNKELKKGIIVMGNEGNGISEEILPLITQPIHIPKFGNSESLNVAIATGIIPSEFARR